MAPAPPAPLLSCATRLLRSSSLSSSLEDIACFLGFFAGRAGEDSESEDRPLDGSRFDLEGNGEGSREFITLPRFKGSQDVVEGGCPDGPAESSSSWGKTNSPSDSVAESARIGDLAKPSCPCKSTCLPERTSLGG